MRILPNWLGSTQRNSRCRAVKPLLRTTRYGGNIKDLKNRIIWRQARHTPPHCLACGTADITLVDYEAINGSELISTNFRHSCGGALVIDYKDNPGLRFSGFDESVVWMDNHAWCTKYLISRHFPPVSNSSKSPWISVHPRILVQLNRDQIEKPLLCS